MKMLSKKLNKCKLNPELINENMTDLMYKLKRHEIEPIDLLRAYQHQALSLHGSGNSGICEFIREAEEQALGLTNSPNADDLPLYGIPVSVKELCPVAGYDCTFGLIKRCNQPAQSDCFIIQALKAQGAIPFVLTSTSQAALSLSGFNPVFGDTSNPHSDKHEPGGSSSGEGVLLALKGSPIGIGTDLAGSIRIPASFCGLAGLKPTSSRLSSKGLSPLHDGQSLVLKVCTGPMGRRTLDLVVMMRALLQPRVFKLDPNIPPLPFNEAMYMGTDKHKLRIGFYDTLQSPSLMQTVPSIRRGIYEAVSFLSNHGHEIVKFVPPNPEKAFEIALTLMNASGTSGLSKCLQGEPVNEHTRFLKLAANLPSPIRSLMNFIGSKMYGEPSALMNTLSGPGNLANCMKLLSDYQNYLEQFEKAWIEAGDLDVLICPVSAFPAIPKSAQSVYVTPSIIYTVLYNLIDYPAGTVPIGHVTQYDIEETKDLCETPNPNLSKFDQQILKAQESSLGLPIGVQVVAQPFKEELVLRVMRELEFQRSKTSKSISDTNLL